MAWLYTVLNPTKAAGGVWWIWYTWLHALFTTLYCGILNPSKSGNTRRRILEDLGVVREIIKGYCVLFDFCQHLILFSPPFRLDLHLSICNLIKELTLLFINAPHHVLCGYNQQVFITQSFTNLITVPTSFFGEDGGGGGGRGKS